MLTTVRALGREDGLHVRRARRPHARRRARRLGSDDEPRGAARAPASRRRRSRPPTAAPRVGHLALAVARSWSNVVTASAGHRVGDRRTAADRPPPRDRPGDPHDRADARRLRRRRVSRHGRRADRHRDGRGDSRPRRRHSGGDRVEDGGDRARARQPEARLSRPRRPAGRRCPRVSAARTGASRRCSSSASPSGSPAAAAGVLVGDVLLEFDGHAGRIARGAARSAARRSRRHDA